MNEDERFLATVREQLDSDARHLDGHSASRLNRARQRALDLGLRPRRPLWRLPALNVAATVAAVLALTLAFNVYRAEPLAPVPVAASAQPLDDFDLLAGNEELEMIENLEFYAWLEQQSLDG